MLWWLAILALAPMVASSERRRDTSWEGYDWDGSFSVAVEEAGPDDATPSVPGVTTLAAAPAVLSVNKTESVATGGGATIGAERFTFWRDVSRGDEGSRRMFGGTRAAPDAVQGRAVALIDSRGYVHCSGAALTSEWILTASHCLTPSVASARTAANPKTVPLIYIYKHPQYKVEQRAVSGGLEVTSLAHDVGLAQAARALVLGHLPPLADTLADMERHDLRALAGRSLTVFGFGRVEGAAAGGGLFSIRTSVGPCVNPAWAPCVCGAGERGVCAGDSGGPVFYNNTQVAVTSLGPMSCSSSEASTSVFTAVRPYVQLIRATVPPQPPPPLGPTAARARDLRAHTGWSRYRVVSPANCPPRLTAPTLLLIFASLIFT